jgi:5-(carboxyamino)imidazole ribonucleotide mutase
MESKITKTKVTMANKALIRIFLGSTSDSHIGDSIKEQLELLQISYDFYISSAHRNPEQTRELAVNAEKDGIKVIIAAAGMAAHLPGVISSYTPLPVIGVPLSGSALKGQDALLAIVQMPTGFPVATVAIDGAKNAAILAAEILALSDDRIHHNLIQYRASFTKA